VTQSRLTARDVVTALLVAGTIGALFPYVTLRLGFGSNVSLVATLLGSVFFAASRPRAGASPKLALHAAQAAGVAAGQTAFMGVALLAFEMVRAGGALGHVARPAPFVVFAWLASAGTIGVLFAIPLRRHYLEDEKLSFAAGEAAGETILVLEGERRPSAAPFLATLVGSIALTLSRATSLSPVALGSGLLLTVRVGVSLACGVALARLLSFAPATASTMTGALRVWPAMGLMLGGGLTTMLARLPALARCVRRSVPRGGPLGLATASVIAAAAVLCVADLALGLPIWLTVASVALSVPLLAVGTRVLGETNWAPVACLGAAAQAALAPLASGCAMTLMVGSTVAAAIPNGGQHMMQSLRTGEIVGARPRETAIAQLLGVLVGSAALSVAFPLLVERFGVHEGGLWSPLSVSWAEFAGVFARGLDALPAGGVAWGVGGAIAGGVIAILERKYAGVLPSPTAIGMGMLMPAGVVLSLLVGSLAGWGIRRRALRAVDPQRIPVAAGLILGEALVASAQAIFALTA
jgi:uncharacterized oligopeptide transporter (OPT) family protein